MSILNTVGVTGDHIDIYTILHPTFLMAVRDNVIRNNPASGVMAKKSKRRRIRHKTRTYIGTAESIFNAMYRTVLCIAIGCHCLQHFLERCRIGEMIGLRWED